MYHFLSGYTAKVAGTEIGVTEPQATFSTCFGAPFMPRHPSVYGNLLKERIAKGGVDCWLVNTGWTGGKYGVGKRMPIKATRALLNAALDGSLKNAEFRKDPNFGFEVPVSSCPASTRDLSIRAAPGPIPAEYDAMAAKLVDLFVENFAQFADQVDEGVRQAARAQGSATSASRKPQPSHRSLAPGRRSGPPRTRPMTEYSPATVFQPTPRSCISAKGSSPHAAASAEWTHEAHLAATTYLLLRRPDMDLDEELPDIIRRYNESVGGVNSDSEGYHETITRVFLHGVRLFLERSGGERAAARARQRAAAVADGPARLAAALLLARPAVLGRGAARVHPAGPRCAAVMAQERFVRAM